MRCCQTTFRSPKSNVAVWVSGMFALLALSTRMPPVELIRFGQPRSSIQRTMSSMWMHMSPTMPLPYSMNARQPRGWTIGVVRPHRGRPGPHLVVEVSGGLRVGRVAVGTHVVVAVDLDQADLAELALA